MENEINNAIYDVAKLISKDEQQVKQLIEIFKSMVEVQFTNEGLDISHTAATVPKIDFKEDNGEFKLYVKKVVVILPPLKNTTNIHHYRIDMRHEFFHAFANLLNNKTIRLNTNFKKMILNVGGKINERNWSNPRTDQNDSQASVLFNEIVTDMSAYCSYYENVKDQVINGNGIESIKNNYGIGNGYSELFPLGVCIIKAFTNYECDYNRLSQNTFEAKYQTDNETVYYNDLLYGILYDPLRIKDKFIKYTTEGDWVTLENISKRILTDFKENGRKVDCYNVQEYLKVLAKYLNNRYQMENDPVLKKHLEQVIFKFNNNYRYAVGYYYNLQQNMQQNNLQQYGRSF